MLPHQQVSFFKFYTFGLYAGIVMLLLSSCVTVHRKKHPKNIPFVFKTNISISGNLPQSEKQELISRLKNQLDDSLKTRSVSWAGIQIISRPPVFDTLNIIRSKTFMKALLSAQGYFYPVINDTFTIVKKKSRLFSKEQDQQRVTINFEVIPGKQTIFDSIGFDLFSPALQKLALESRSQSLLKKGNPYSIQSIAEERERLLQVFHNNGYYKVSGEDIYAERDTVIAALIDPSLDPFEQIRLLDSLRRKKDRPTITVVFKQSEPNDSTHLKKFYIGSVDVYPDQSYFQDTASFEPKPTKLANYKFTFFPLSNRFKLPFIARTISLVPNTPYDERNYFKTINTFNRLGAWQSVDLSLKERYDSIPFLDATLKLYPAQKQNLKIDLEASRNVADYLTTSQLFGVGLNFSLTNRNTFKEAIQTSTNARFGIEFGSNFIQTLQANLSHSIYFPRLITPFRVKKIDSLLNSRTVFNINGAYTIRRSIYNVSSLNTSWGYEWTTKFGKKKHPINWQFSLPNVEYTLLNGKDSLDKLIEQIPSLRFAFNDGFVIGVVGGLNTAWTNKNHFSYFKFRVEESGALFGLIKKLEENNLFRFVKTDIEYKHLINYKQSSWAFRVFGGYGYVYGKKGNQPENKLPFFKAYFAGGPYSMRAWQVRRLGPGSSKLYDTVSTRSNDRFGNMQLEANVEYRFNLTTIAGIKVKSALFVDAGNIWGIEFNPNASQEKIPEASFNFSRLGKDIAIGGGASLRFDFDFFLIRLDWAYKLKDPSFSSLNNGWFHNLKLTDGQFQLGIGYPF